MMQAWSSCPVMRSVTEQALETAVLHAVMPDLVRHACVRTVMELVQFQWSATHRNEGHAPLSKGGTHIGVIIVMNAERSILGGEVLINERQTSDRRTMMMRNAPGLGASAIAKRKLTVNQIHNESCL
jgi:hypothetical protein